MKLKNIYAMDDLKMKLYHFLFETSKEDNVVIGLFQFLSTPITNPKNEANVWSLIDSRNRIRIPKRELEGASVYGLWRSYPALRSFLASSRIVTPLPFTPIQQYSHSHSLSLSNRIWSC